MPLALSPNSEPKPDIAVVARIPGDYQDAPPKKAVLIIEVAESSSLPFDRGIKKKLYACSGVPEYWIVNLKDSCFEVYKYPVKESYEDMKKYYKESLFEKQDNLSGIEDIILNMIMK